MGAEQRNRLARTLLLAGVATVLVACTAVTDGGDRIAYQNR